MVFVLLLNPGTSSQDIRAQGAIGIIAKIPVVLAQVKKEDVPSKPKPAIRPGAEPYRPRTGGAAKDTSSGKSNSVEGTTSPSTGSVETGGTRRDPSLHLQKTQEISDDRSSPAEQPAGRQPGNLTIRSRRSTFLALLFKCYFSYYMLLRRV
jgi:hypothetical protein